MRRVSGILGGTLFLIICMLVPSSSYAWRHDHVRFGVDIGGPVVYHDDYYYNYPSYVYVSTPEFQPVVINGVTYYVNNGQYYLYTPAGYQLVSPAPVVVQAAPVSVNVASSSNAVTAQIAAGNTEDEYTLNIPNDKGGYTSVIIKKSGNGFAGPQGEYYSEFPKVSQLKVMYGK